MHLLIAFVVGVFAGGFGEYKWGAAVQKKAASQLQALANSAVKKLG